MYCLMIGLIITKKVDQKIQANNGIYGLFLCVAHPQTSPQRDRLWT